MEEHVYVSSLRSVDKGMCMRSGRAGAVEAERREAAEEDGGAAH